MKTSLHPKNLKTLLILVAALFCTLILNAGEGHHGHEHNNRFFFETPVICAECGVANLLYTCSNCAGTGQNSGAECGNCKGSGQLHEQCSHAYVAPIDAIPELEFSNALLLSGVDGQEGAVYLFKNVTSQFDATIKLKKFSSPDIYMRNFDNTTFGWGKAFQPEFGMNSVLPNQNWYIDFEMTFLEAGTTNIKKADRFTITSLDVDGDGFNVKEYALMEKASSVSYSTASYLINGGGAPAVPTCCECSKSSEITDCTRCTGSGQVRSKSGSRGSRMVKCYDCDGVGKVYSDCKHAYCGEDAAVQGPTDNFANIDTTSTAVMATYVYNNKESITFRIGAISGGNTGGAGVRLNSLWFRAFSLAPIAILPVTLTEFTASLEKKTVVLNWKTEMEENFSHFVIESSTDGKEFTGKATIFSAGDRSSHTLYAYKDHIQSQTGILYYRLKSVDKTGEINYSKIRMIKISNDHLNSLVINAYPNPVSSSLRLTIPAKWQGNPMMVEVFNANGMKVHGSQYGNASQTESIALNKLSKGFYVIKATSGNETAQQHIIKN